LQLVNVGVEFVPPTVQPIRTNPAKRRNSPSMIATNPKANRYDRIWWTLTPGRL
jgi:hypothetical protein